MNEQLQTQLASVIKSLVDAVTAAKDFALDQLPSVVAEFLVYARVTETLDVVLSLGLMLALGVTAKRLHRKGVSVSNGDTWGNPAEPYYCGATFAAVFALGCFVVALMNLNELIMVWAAPKVYLIKHIAVLVR
jgi:hypothetical protein